MNGDGFSAARVIARKRDGQELSDGDVAAFLRGFTDGSIPDYQMSALAMALVCRGMSARETAALTEVMWRSGTTLQWPPGTVAVDKHSTGGVGDKISLVLAPLVACCDLQVPMISGRGLGPTGGTLDKLESIPGFRTDLSISEIVRQAASIGCVITGATADIAPADRRLYALRDVTATVESVGLITASIMSKKLSENLAALVLDVKFGSGAFMPSLDEARRLARSLVDTGNRMGVRTSALITDMNQPLGRMAGNAVEIDESLDVLQGRGPADVRALTLVLGAELLVATGRATAQGEALDVLAAHLDSGRAAERFRQMVRAQGGDLERPRHVAPARPLAAGTDGWIRRIDTRRIGEAVIELGGGRKVAGAPIDHAVGIEMLVRIGDRVAAGQDLARLFGGERGAAAARELVGSSIEVGDAPCDPLPLVVERIA